MTGDDHPSRERLRRRLIRGVFLSAIYVAVEALLSRKRWNSNLTFGLISAIAMMAGVLIYAYFLRPGSKLKQ